MSNLRGVENISLFNICNTKNLQDEICCDEKFRNFLIYKNLKIF